MMSMHGKQMRVSLLLKPGQKQNLYTLSETTGLSVCKIIRTVIDGADMHPSIAAVLQSNGRRKGNDAPTEYCTTPSQTGCA